MEPGQVFRETSQPSGHSTAYQYNVPVPSPTTRSSVWTVTPGLNGLREGRCMQQGRQVRQVIGYGCCAWNRGSPSRMDVSMSVPSDRPAARMFMFPNDDEKAIEVNQTFSSCKPFTMRAPSPSDQV
ncbi:hypothetical protein G6O67_005717 [Ophiocordyceps sinensis]|uniref:Uncharacterized protein n=1 Tax=Ophiocordyceps sinensis TaxID=72228 RepID=A0A8H4PND0_9HYPO|nr:hypothetical protein G6O67_005717 [Ophiocordyceps sinensis]